ncbi:phospholipase-like protein [Tanacetum coccineum]
MLGRQMLFVGGETENVPLYYHMYDNFQIQFGRKEFCLVSGLNFGVEYSDEYDDKDKPIPFRRRVFPSCLDGKPITGKDVEQLIDSNSFKKLDDDDAVSLCCVGIVQLVLLGLEDRRLVPNWILRLANDRDGWDNYPWGSYVWPTLYYNLRDANVKRWLPLYATESTNEDGKKSYSLLGFMALRTWILEMFRLGPNDIFHVTMALYKNSAWTSIKKGLVPAERLIPDEAEARSGWSVLFPDADKQLCQTNWKTSMPSQPGSSNWQSQMPAYTPTPNWQPPIPSHPGDAGLCDPQMNSWIEILIRSRPQDADWTVSKSGTACVHPENNRFLIETDPHIIGMLDGSTRPYPSWKNVNWVYMPINVGGNHWVTGAVNLSHSVFFVFDSMESQSTRFLLEAQIKAWTPVINGILQTRGYFDGSERQYHNFILSYNQGWGFSVPQQTNSKDCGVITCWLIAKLCASHVPVVPRESESYWENIRYEMGKLFYKCRCENTRYCGYD